MSMTARFMPRPVLQDLLNALHKNGYECIGPTVRDGAIVYDTVSNVSELPAGYRDVQRPGHYRLEQHNDDYLFAWANGPQGIKPHLFKPRETLWSAHKGTDGRLHITEHAPAIKKRAILGARPCDITALYLQDDHFLQSNIKDPYYMAHRQELLVITVNCTHPAETCFCASTGDGPRASFGYDLAMTELDDGFVIQAHSPNGVEILSGLALEEATDVHFKQADTLIEAAAAKQVRSLPGRNLSRQLFDHLEHPQWDDVAGRCLSCGNCTSVCPSCFCHSESDHGHLDLTHSEHIRQWDSCFTQQHSYIHGLTIRSETRQRYRQWLTHKLGGWHEQYGRSGCVGCGRCISWCPAGIDLTAEVRAITGDADHD